MNDNTNEIICEKSKAALKGALPHLIKAMESIAESAQLIAKAFKGIDWDALEKLERLE